MPISEMHPELNEKEQRVLEKLKRSRGLVLAHGVGSGKTRSSIQAANQLGLDTDVVVPAALKDNYKKELHKWLQDHPEEFRILSQQGIARSGLENPRKTLIVDEAHRAREENSKLLKELKKTPAEYRMLLTGSPVYNKPSDLAPLVNLAAGKSVLPEDPRKFEEKFVARKSVSPGLLGLLLGAKPGEVPQLKNKDQLTKVLKQYVDYEPSANSAEFPSSKEETLKVPMSREQRDIYNTIMGKAPMWLRWKVRAGLPPNRKELNKLQAFLGGARQVSNSSRGFVREGKPVQAPKLDEAANYLLAQLDANPRYKGVVYSNYIDSGLNPYKQRLQEKGVPFGEFTGQLSPAERDQMVRDYNANKLRALLISSAGAEGLDLKGTRLLQILEPHFNREKEKQVIGRAIRYRSHEGLPEDERNVLVQRYLSTLPPGTIDRLLFRKNPKGVDEYISSLAEQKERLNEQVLEILKTEAR